MIKSILFDLDGTLLLSDSDKFTAAYFAELVKYLAKLHEPEALTKAVWAGTKAMVKNDGSQTNEEAFWKTYCGIFGEASRTDESAFAEFYAVKYPELKVLCGKHPGLGSFVKELRSGGYQLAVATNPLFPLSVQRERVSWTGADPDDFALITAYEESHFSKPNPDYYREIISRMGMVPEECLMVGNDVKEDMEAASQTGMQVFLLPEFLLNRENKEYSVYPQGDFSALKRFIAENGIGK